MFTGHLPKASEGTDGRGGSQETAEEPGVIGAITMPQAQSGARDRSKFLLMAESPGNGNGLAR